MTPRNKQKFIDRLKSLFMPTTEYKYTSVDTRISNGEVHITKIKKTGDAAKDECDKAFKEMNEEIDRLFR